MQGFLARAVRHVRAPAGNVLLRPLAASTAIPRLQPFARCFATGGKGKKVVVTKAPPSVTSQLVKKLNDEVMYEIKNYESPPSIEHGPPKGWEKIEIGDIIGDDEGFVVVERKFKNEKICVLTSTQVLDKDVMDEDIDDEEEAPEIDDDDEEGQLAEAICLVAITKDTQTEPLFIECHMDRFGIQIARAHIGSGLSGLHDEMRGPSGILYHAYMAYRQEGAAVEETMALAEEARMVSSPDFQTLDDDLQEAFDEFLVERGVDPDLTAYLFDCLEDKEQNHYLRFLTAAKSWISDAPATPPTPPSP